MPKEYGGYLALELPQRAEYYSDFDDRTIRMNSGRSAIRVALELMGAKRVHTPYYLCESVLGVYKQLGLPYCFYNIDENYMPMDVSILPGDAIIWVNYFGIVSQETQRTLTERYGSTLIIDNTQAFFTQPAPECYNVYSCRKFFGVPDGAYLIGGKASPAMRYPEIRSHEKYHHILKSMELGTNAAYPGHLENEQQLDNEFGEMSGLTRRVLGSLDYEQIKEKRSRNYAVLHSLLGSKNAVPPHTAAREARRYTHTHTHTHTAAPMVYPFLHKSAGLRRHLTGQKIYVPQWWKHVIDYPEINGFEKDLSMYLFPLPIDQRYSKNDMEHIAGVILDFIR